MCQMYGYKLFFYFGNTNILWYNTAYPSVSNKGDARVEKLKNTWSRCWWCWYFLRSIRFRCCRELPGASIMPVLYEMQRSLASMYRRQFDNPQFLDDVFFIWNFLWRHCSTEVSDFQQTILGRDIPLSMSWESCRLIASKSIKVLFGIF